MIVTRKIKIYVTEKDKDLKKEMYKKIHLWRDWTRKAANIIVAHKFVQQNVRDFIYFTEEIQDKFYISDCLKKGKGMSASNITYKLCSNMMKGQVPSNIFSCLNQTISTTFNKEAIKVSRGEISLRSYKNNIPMPFKGEDIRNLHYSEENKRFEFSWFKIPFACALGNDRSNNQDIIERCINGEYKICGSSISIISAKDKFNDDTSSNNDKEDKKEDGDKIFLHLSVDMPQREYKPVKDKKLFACLDVMTPIVYAVNIKAKQIYDSGVKSFKIGSAEEFNYRRRQIQEAVRRCQMDCRYSQNGKGRKKKMQALERFHEKEKNYIDTKLHMYSRKLVDAAVKNRCAEIVLLNQTKRETKAKEDNAKGENFVLRNWSFYNLKDKIDYKCKQYGIKLTVE